MFDFVCILLLILMNVIKIRIILMNVIKIRITLKYGTWYMVHACMNHLMAISVTTQGSILHANSKNAKFI